MSNVSVGDWGEGGWSKCVCVCVRARARACVCKFMNLSIHVYYVFAYVRVGAPCELHTFRSFFQNAGSQHCLRSEQYSQLFCFKTSEIHRPTMMEFFVFQTSQR